MFGKAPAKRASNIAAKAAKANLQLFQAQAKSDRLELKALQSPGAVKLAKVEVDQTDAEGRSFALRALPWVIGGLAAAFIIYKIATRNRGKS